LIQYYSDVGVSLACNPHEGRDHVTLSHQRNYLVFICVKRWLYLIIIGPGL
jgi:hypothetical protein